MLHLSRRHCLHIAGASSLLALPAFAQIPAAAAQSKLRRIKMATIAGDDLPQIEKWYAGALGYQAAERGMVSAALAASWGTPAMTGRPFIVMQPESGEDVFIRAVEIDPIVRAKPLTTWGWSAIEIVVRNLDEFYDKLKDGWLGAPITVLGEPKPLSPGSPIYAMQILGPAGEILYLTSNTGDRLKSNHPDPIAPVGRPFIAVLAGPDLAKLKSFYKDGFTLADQGDISLPVASRAKAHGLPLGHVYTMSVVVCAERGNKIELDGFPPGTAPQPRHPGQLPGGTAMMSFSVAGFKDLTVRTITPPAVLYKDQLAATLSGPAGELTELIADRPEAANPEAKMLRAKSGKAKGP